MLARSTSSRRRSSRSTSSSPQARGTRSAATSPGRRASIAVSPVDSERASRNALALEINRSPRHSIIPDISLEVNSSENLVHNGAGARSPRSSLVPDAHGSNRNLPDGFARGSRHSLVPNDIYARSPRNSLVPDSALSPRNSLVPDVGHGRNQRNSLVPDGAQNKSPRNSLVPDGSRSPRHSLVPDNNMHNSKMNLAASEYTRTSPRNSLLPDGSRSPRQSLTPSESMTWDKGGHDDGISSSPGNRSPRHNISPDCNRSPRGSIAPESLFVRTSPRGSIASEHIGDRSPRGSIGPECNMNRSPRGSIVRNNLTTEYDAGRIPRGSLTLTFQEPPISERRSSADNPSGSRGSGVGRSTSPYRPSSKCVLNMGSSGNSGQSEGGSRRASSSVSQVSGDEQRRLFSQRNYPTSNERYALNISLTTYGSVAYQLKDANLESSGTCDFVIRALSILSRTAIVKMAMVALSVLPIVMLIMGVQYLRDCPRENYIPVYLIVAGAIGTFRMGWLTWEQMYTRNVEAGRSYASSLLSKISSWAFSMFLIIWFVLGNYWILRIKWPDYSPTLFEPNCWCHRNLYIFSLTHLCIVYATVASCFLLMMALAGCHIYGCSWLGPTRNREFFLWCPKVHVRTDENRNYDSTFRYVCHHPFIFTTNTQ